MTHDIVHDSSRTPGGPQRLPGELWVAVASHLTLPSLLALTCTSRFFRQLCTTEARVWSRSLPEAAKAAGIWVGADELADNNPGAETRARNILATLGTSIYSPPALSWARLLPNLSRAFIAFELEIPRLTEEDWRAAFLERFAPSVVQKETAGDHDGTGNGWRWRERFLRTVSRLEHRAETSCAHQSNYTRYLVLHRTYGLTLNRIGTREFDPFACFDELKRQSSLTSYTTVQVMIPGHLCPPDIEVSVLVTIGRHDSCLRNDLAMDCLDSLGGWRGGKETSSSHAILGPALISCTIKRSPEVYRSGKFSSVMGLDLEDWFAICAPVGLTEEWWRGRCAVKWGGGFV